ncbi:MAG: nucleotidyltransferase domain-containing protein [Promethearchaeota archaeon]
MELEEIRTILNSLKEKYDVIMFGSAVEGGIRPNSDIDIAVITYTKDLEKNKRIQKNLFGVAPLKYDIRIFELFPIYIQISIINRYLIIFGNPLEISEYFYSFYKKWDDCKYRILSNQFRDYHERLSLIK